MRRFLPALLLLMFTVPARAQTLTQTPPTLAAVLHAQRMPEPGAVLLSVGADKVTLPKGANPPDAGDSAESVAAAYGQAAQWFGITLAVAPKDMTVLYAPPETPNPYDGMPPGQVMKLLTKTWTPAHWKAFLSAAGVAYSDMTTDTQRSLFAALFPQGHLVAQKDNPTGENDPHAKQDVSGDALLQAHLRLVYTTSIALPVPGKPGTHSFTATFRTAGAPALYYMTNAQSDEVDHEFGATVQATVPNTLKDGALRFDSAALRVPVSVENLHTVDELVARIGTVCPLELYADPRYGSRSVTLAGAARTARASELLQALALCVHGAYRHVGPAFVLTDDVTGLAVKRALWSAFESNAKSLLPVSADDGNPFGPPRAAGFTRKDIAFGDDPLAFTPAQQAQYWAEWRKNPMGFAGGDMQLRDVPFADLSAAQQEAAQRSQTYNDTHHFSTTLDGLIMLQAEPEVEVVLPALDGPALLFGGYDNLLPDPPLTPAEQKAQEKRMEAEFPDPLPPEDAPAPHLAALMKTFTRRAVRVAPTAVAEAKRAAQRAKRAGFNELWLQVLPGQLSQSDAVLLVTAAVTEGKKAGVAVLPDVFLLRWQNAPPALVDRDVRGLTMAEAAVLNPSRLWNEHDTVTPFAPDVQKQLAELMAALSGVSGIGGMVWDEWCPNGYDEETARDTGFTAPLGYALAGRLAFLRLVHADPLDVYDNGVVTTRASIKVPGFDDGYGSQPMRALSQKWQTLRARTAQNLAQTLAATARASGGSPRIIVPGAQYASLYGSWDDTRRPPPVTQFVFARSADGGIVEGASATERMACAVVYRTASVMGTLSDAQWAKQAAFAVQNAAKQGDKNIVIDASGSPARLDALAR